MKALILCMLMILTTPIYSHAAAISAYRTNSVGYEEKTPSEYTFRLENDSNEFILLDELEDGFLVMTKKYASSREPFDPDNTGKFDVEDENNIAYWLNNDFLNTQIEGVNPLPQAIKDSLVEHEWLTEAGHPDTFFNEDYTTKCKIALLSQTEWNEYCLNQRRIGCADDTSNAYWLLRSTEGTQKQTNIDYIAGVLVALNNGTTSYGKAVTGAAVRPVFVLAKDFFEKNKLDLNNSGSVALYAVQNALGKEKLASIYGSLAAEKIDSSILPMAKKVKYTGIIIEGRELTGEYEYYSINNKAQSGTICRWLRSSEKDGYYSPINGAEGMTYTLQSSDVGKYIKFEVIPQTEINSGRAVRSDAFLISAETTPVAFDVKLMGEGVSGEEMYIEYHYSDGNDEPEYKAYFRWQVSEDGVNFTDIDGADKATFIPDNSYLGKYIRSSVIVEKLGDGTGKKSEEVFTQAAVIKSKPQATDVTVSGSNILSGSYSYIDAQNTVEKGTQCIWEASRTENGIYKSVGIGEGFNAAGAYEDYFIRFSVIPQNADGTIGEKVSSKPIKISGVTQMESYCDKVTAESGKIIAVKPEKSGFFSNAIIEINAKNAEINSKFFEVVTSSADGKILCMLIPKTGTQAVFVDSSSELLRIRGASGEVSIISAEVQGLGDAIPVELGMVVSASAGAGSSLGTPSSGSSSGSLSTGSELDKSGKYSDISGVEWAIPAISALSERGIVDGTGNGMFSPNNNVKREEFAKMIVIGFNLPKSDNAVEFADINTQAWYGSYIADAMAAGVINGYDDGRFGVGDYITREDMAVMLYRAMKDKLEKSEVKAEFKDSQMISDYALEAVSALYLAGIMTGSGDGNIAPKENATRAMAAKMLYMALEIGD